MKHALFNSEQHQTPMSLEAKTPRHFTKSGQKDQDSKKVPRFFVFPKEMARWLFWLWTQTKLLRYIDLLLIICYDISSLESCCCIGRSSQKMEDFFQQPTSLSELCFYVPAFCLEGNSCTFAWWSTSARWWCWATWMWIINRFQIQTSTFFPGKFGGKQECI